MTQRPGHVKAGGKGVSMNDSSSFGSSLLDVREAAALLKIHPGSLYRLCAKRGIIFYRVPGVGLRFRPSDLDKFIDRSRRTKKDLATIAGLD
jgi:excisionase family DNA binding protein